MSEMVEQLDLFSYQEQYRITKPIFLIEAFGGIGAQRKGLEVLGVPLSKNHILIEWSKESIKAYARIHNMIDDEKIEEICKGKTKEEMLDRIKGCILTDKSGNLTKFHPLIKVNDEWEKWIVEEKHIELAKVYLPPYNFKRTGCMGCPFSLDLQEQLEIMELYMPNERKQCEYIWKPVYDEYRRLNYRLKRVEKVKLL